GNGGAMWVGSQAMIRNNEFSSNAADESSWGGAIYVQGATTTIQSNTFNSNSANGGAAINIFDADSVIAGNYITGNTGWSSVRMEPDINQQVKLILYNNIFSTTNSPAGGFGFGLSMNSGSEWIHLIYNNTFVAQAVGIKCMDTDSRSMDISNNIFASNVTGSIQCTGATITGSNNLFSNNGFNDYPLANPMYVADPLFDIYSYDGLHLGGQSPAIDHGINIDWMVDDYDGQARPMGTFDIGADEYYAFIYLPMIQR
ncbi:MAG TPA: right-handed parallel beta-helix repeat-containing protein, partial [Anaerolineaceae bacterium]|nr:right-handed parallel beta-helix repeat-containing protein [Anaerolineaceae bacterium]